MSFDAYALANRHITALSPYQPGKPIEELQRELQISDVIKLASNENPLGPSRLAIEAMQRAVDDLNFYPDGSGYKLKQRLAKKMGVLPEQITLGNGSDDIFNFIVRAFAGPESSVVMSEYGFAAFAIAAKAMNSQILLAPTKNWQQDLSAMLSLVQENTCIIYFANPNNPTGTWVAKDQFDAFMKQVPKNILVVVDQAYFEYMQDEQYPDAKLWLNDYPNLIVTYTFSKAFGLAGLRVGYSLSSPAICDLLNRIRLPFNVNALGLLAAEHALDDEIHLQKTCEITKQGLEQFEMAFTQLGLDYISSGANFMTVALPKSGLAVYQAMLKLGVIIRPLEPYHLPQHVRISVGLPEHNSRCLSALEKVIKTKE